MGQAKEINIENQTYYFFKDMIDVKSFHSNLLKVDKIVSTNLFRRVFVWFTKMLQYDGIDVSEGIDINKASKPKKCMLCHYWYFKDISFKFQPYLCHGCHAVPMMAYELKNIAILHAKGVDCRCMLWGISRDEVVNRLNNSVLEDEGVL